MGWVCTYGRLGIIRFETQSMLCLWVTNLDSTAFEKRPVLSAKLQAEGTTLKPNLETLRAQVVRLLEPKTYTAIRDFRIC